MAFPQTLNPAFPAITDSPQVTYSELDGIKQLLADVFGLPTSPLSIAAAATIVGTDGQMPSVSRLSNNTGVALVAGDVVAVDTTSNKSVILDDTSASVRPYVVALESIGTTAAGRFATGGVVTVNTTGTIARGRYVKKSATTKAVDDAGVTASATAAAPAGSVGIALAAAASGTAVVLWFTRPTPASTAANAYQAGRLTLSGANLQYAPYNGNQVVINSNVQTIPDAGVTLAATGAVASTTYFIYAYMSGGTLTLEFSTTTHATQAGTGVEIKSGDATRTLVGMARTTLATAWADSATQRFTISWFNRQNISGVSAFTANRSTGSAVYVEINSEIEVAFVTWGTESVLASCEGTMANSGANTGSSSIGFDGATPEEAYARSALGATTIPFGVTAARALTEGYHFATLLGFTSAGTETWEGSAALGGRTALKVTVRG